MNRSLPLRHERDARASWGIKLRLYILVKIDNSIFIVYISF